MLSARGQSFLALHKRRRHASDARFLEALLARVGFSNAVSLLKFQSEFGGYVSPTFAGQQVWGLQTTQFPEVLEIDGVLQTPCTDDVRFGPRIDAQGRYYLGTSKQVPVASSVKIVFEQMAAIHEWQAAACFDSPVLVSHSPNAARLYSVLAENSVHKDDFLMTIASCLRATSSSFASARMASRLGLCPNTRA